MCETGAHLKNKLFLALANNLKLDNVFASLNSYRVESKVDVKKWLLARSLCSDFTVVSVRPAECQLISVDLTEALALSIRIFPLAWQKVLA